MFMNTSLISALVVTLGGMTLWAGEVVAPPPAQAATPKTWSFDIETEWLHNDDLSDSTAALSWDIKWATENDNAPFSYFEARFASHGTLAIDEDLNRTPLVAELDGYGYLQLGSERSLTQAAPRIRDVERDIIPDLTKTKFHPMLLEGGLSARYETDQRLDHRNGVASVFVQLSNNNRESAWALIPTVRVTLDGVEPDENTTAEALTAETESHLRFRALAHWNIGLALLGRTPVLANSFLSATLEYSHDFDIDQKLEDAGQDEAFGAAVEYAYLLNGGVREGDLPNEAPLFVFARLETGTFAPEPEDSTTFLVGFRYGMGDVMKLFSR
jgi:hypothetical protein